MNKKKLASVFSTLGIICLVAAFVTLLDLPTYIKVWTDKVMELEAVGENELQVGDVVKGSIDTVLGPCAEMYETNYGVRTSDESSKLYYIIMLNNDKCVLYEAASKIEYNTLDRITDETYDYYESLADYAESGDPLDIVQGCTTMDIQGKVKKIPSEIEGYFREAYGEIFDDTFEEGAEAIMISGMKFDNFVIMTIIGGVSVVLGIVFFILAFVFAKKGQRQIFDEY